MGHQEVPEHGAEALGVRGDVVEEERRDDDARLGELGGRTAVATDDPVDPRSAGARQLEGADDVGGDVLCGVATTHGEHEQGVVLAEA